MVRVRVILASSLSLLALAARGTDEKAKSADDALAVTKRELETMKSEHLHQGGNAPQFQLPDAIDNPSLPTTGGLQTFSNSKKKQDELLKSKGRAKNWLVDGVQKNATPNSRDAFSGQRSANDASRGASGNGDAEDEIDPVTGRPTELATTSVDAEKNPTKNDREMRARDSKFAKETPPDNPLDRYLGDWMSARDYALLKKTGEVGQSARIEITSGDASFNSTATGGFSSPTAVQVSAPSMVDVPSSAGASTAARDNPYLSTFSASPGVSGPGPTSITESMNSPAYPPGPLTISTAPLGPAPDPRPATTLPENLKRTDDAKYFPQLKRF